MKQTCNSSKHPGATIEFEVGCGTNQHYWCPMCKMMDRSRILAESPADFEDRVIDTIRVEMSDDFLKNTNDKGETGKAIVWKLADKIRAMVFDN